MAGFFTLALLLTFSFSGFAVPQEESVAQEVQEETTYDAPKLLFGIAGAANINFYEGTTRHLNDDFIAPAAFHDGFGIKPYGAALLEYNFNDMWGLTLNAGFDGRGGLFDEVMAPCDMPSELETDLSYIAIEPSLKFSPFRSGLHLFAGPRFSMVYNDEFTYEREVQHTNETEYWTEEGEWGDLRDSFLSFQVGAGYDIMLSSNTKQTKYVLTPFVSYHPYFGQEPRDVDTWSINTVRAGLALKIGKGVPVPPPPEPEPEPEPEVEAEEEPEAPEPEIPPVNLTVRPPVLEERQITNEVFPLRNYVFFDDHSSIPDRYNLLTPAEADDFTSDDLPGRVYAERDMSSQKQMRVYYNILNILGERMNEAPNSTVTLIGSSAGEGLDNGRSQAEAVKAYLVDIFGIDAERIYTSGREWPEKGSYSHPGQEQVDLRISSDRRVDIMSTSTELLMGDQTAFSGLLKPIKISLSDEGPLDSHVVFNVSNADRYLDEWFIEMTDEEGHRVEYGPFTGSRGSVPVAEVLEEGVPGSYTVEMKATSREGLDFVLDSSVDLHPLDVEETHVTRFSMLYEFDASDTHPGYKNYLVENVAPQVPDRARVVIHGHTDIIGDPEHNYQLSVQRANNARELIENTLIEMGKEGVTFEVYGSGELTDQTPFDNDLPEQRFYNRTVIIDIYPE